MYNLVSCVCHLHMKFKHKHWTVQYFSGYLVSVSFFMCIAKTLSWKDYERQNLKMKWVEIELHAAVLPGERMFYESNESMSHES